MTLHIERAIAGAGIIAMLAVIGLAAPAAAQAQDPQTVEAAAPAPDQLPAPRPAQPAVGSPYWATIGGFAMDSDDAGYGFVGPQYIRPFRPSMAFIGSANANYLYYEFATPSGHTNVRSPGVNVMGGLMFGGRNWVALQAGPSFKRRYVERLDPADNVIDKNRDVHVGFNLGTSAWYDPTPHNNIFAMYTYETVDAFHWGRLAFKEQIANRSWQGDWTPFLGASYTGSGNENIVTHQIGPFVELAHRPSGLSVLVGGGYKYSEYDFEPNKRGTWFTVGFYHRLP
jgi:hypothetical protein